LDYINAHWHDLGSDHFIALCTGINIALIGWPGFQDRVRYAESRIEEKLTSVSASFLDQERFQTLVKKCQETAFVIQRWGWRIIFTLALVAALAGATMLYLKKSCPYDFLLLLPTIFQLGLSWITLGLAVAWTNHLRRVFGLPSSKRAKGTVAAFASSTDQYTPVIQDEHVAAEIVSQPRAGPGHKHRSSDNFSIDVPPGCYALRWECPPGVKFSIRHAVQFSSASVIFLNLSNGSRTRIPPGGERDRCYVADPIGSKTEFVIRAFALCRQ
jgi:hypothetical protein